MVKKLHGVTSCLTDKAPDDDGLVALSLISVVTAALSARGLASNDRYRRRQIVIAASL